MFRDSWMALALTTITRHTILSADKYKNVSTSTWGYKSVIYTLILRLLTAPSLGERRGVGA